RDSLIGRHGNQRLDIAQGNGARGRQDVREGTIVDVAGQRALSYDARRVAERGLRSAPNCPPVSAGRAEGLLVAAANRGFPFAKPGELIGEAYRRTQVAVGRRYGALLRIRRAGAYEYDRRERIRIAGRSRQQRILLDS